LSGSRRIFQTRSITTQTVSQSSREEELGRFKDNQAYTRIEAQDHLK
jgi:hypothetical protein